MDSAHNPGVQQQGWPGGSGNRGSRAQLPQREITISSISLIAQAPEQLWTWNLVAQVSFGTELPVGEAK